MEIRTITYANNDQKHNTELNVAALRGLTRRIKSAGIDAQVQGIVEVLDPRMETVALDPIYHVTPIYSVPQAESLLYTPRYQIGGAVAHVEEGVLPGRKKLYLDSEDGDRRTVISYKKIKGEIEALKVTNRERRTDKVIISFPRIKTVWKK